MLNAYLLLIAIVNQLTWADYKGKPDSILVSKGFIAHTETSWVMNSDEDSAGNLIYTIDFAFIPEKSWTICSSPEVLKHELTHYYISQMWSIKCQKRLQQCKNITNEKAINIFNHCWKESRKLQILFDRETHHGIYTEIEKIWERNILNDLK